MRLPRLYIACPLQSDTEIALDERAHRHVVQVLRLKSGDAIRLFNGDGREFLAQLTKVQRRQSRAQVQQALQSEAPSPLSITLLQGIAKGDHMDYGLQKATELGVDAIQPLITQRAVVRLQGERLHNKIAHWQGVLISASEQCGRRVLPQLLEPLTFEQWLQTQAGAAQGFVLDPQAGPSLAQSPLPASQLNVLIGPEGGLTQEEIAQATSSGLQAVRLGPRVLRTETAAVVTLTALQVLWGDLRDG